MFIVTHQTFKQIMFDINDTTCVFFGYVRKILQILDIFDMALGHFTDLISPRGQFTEWSIHLLSPTFTEYHFTELRWDFEKF